MDGLLCTVLTLLKKTAEWNNTLIKCWKSSRKYILFGYSAGGNTAFEAAKAMEKRGLEISDVIIADAYRKLDALPQQPTNATADNVPEAVREAVIKRQSAIKRTGRN